MKKLSLFLLLVLFAAIGCEKLMKEDIFVEDPELQALSDGLDADIGLSKSSINAFNDALNRHGKIGKHRRDPGFLWKVAAELQAELSDDEKQRLFGWMDDQLVPYLYGANMDKRGGHTPGGPDRGGIDIKMLHTVLDDAQKETLRTILDSYRTQMSAVMNKVKDGTLDRAAAKAELEALETAMHAEIDALLTDDQKAVIDAKLAEMQQKMEAMRQAAHDAMVGALEMTSDEEAALATLNKESAEAQNALLEKARVETAADLRFSIYSAVEQMILDDAPWIPLWYSGERYLLVKPNVHDYLQTPLIIPKLKHVYLTEE